MFFFISNVYDGNYNVWKGDSIEEKGYWSCYFVCLLFGVNWKRSLNEMSIKSKFEWEGMDRFYFKVEFKRSIFVVINISLKIFYILFFIIKRIIGWNWKSKERSWIESKFLIKMIKSSFAIDAN